MREQLEVTETLDIRERSLENNELRIEIGGDTEAEVVDLIVKRLGMEPDDIGLGRSQINVRKSMFFDTQHTVKRLIHAESGLLLGTVFRVGKFKPTSSYESDAFPIMEVAGSHNFYGVVFITEDLQPVAWAERDFRQLTAA